MIRNDEAAFASASYRDLLAEWQADPDDRIRLHAKAVLDRFDL